MSYFIFYYADAARLQAHQLSTPLLPYIPHSHWSFYYLFVSVPALFIILYVIGICEASTSFTSELRDKKWELQKRSTLRPIHLTIGKLFGVTSYAWYCSFGMLSTILYAYSNMFENVGTLVNPILMYPTLKDIALLSIMIILSAFCGHLTATTVSLINLSNGKVGNFVPFLSGLTAAFFSYGFVLIVSKVMFIDDGFYQQGPSNWTWFSYHTREVYVVVSAIIILAIWTCIVLHRRVRRELGYHNSTYTWLLFSATLSLYWSGYGDMIEIDRPMAPQIIGIMFQFCSIAMLIFFFSTYCSIYYESSRLNNYREFFTSISNRAYKTSWKILPSWILNYVVFSFLMITYFSIKYMYPFGSDDYVDSRNIDIALIIFLNLFMLRDGIVMHICLLGKYFKRGGLMLRLYYLLAYLVLPFLVYSSVNLYSNYFGVDVNALQDNVVLQHIKCFFILNTIEPYMLSKFLPVMFEIIIFGYILRKVITKNQWLL